MLSKFWKKYKAYKAFNLVHVQDKTSVIRGKDVAYFEGWMTRFQIGDHQKLPVYYPLMVALLADLPSRTCNNISWREAGEMAYYYQGRIFYN